MPRSRRESVPTHEEKLILGKQHRCLVATAVVDFMNDHPVKEQSTQWNVNTKEFAQTSSNPELVGVQQLGPPFTQVFPFEYFNAVQSACFETLMFSGTNDFVPT